MQQQADSQAFLRRMARSLPSLRLSSLRKLAPSLLLLLVTKIIDIGGVLYER